jgi:hypothetical protein
VCDGGRGLHLARLEMIRATILIEHN